MSLYCRVIFSNEINLFVHSFSQDRQKLYGPNNFGTLFYEVISFPFMLWKFYLDVLARVVLNHCNKFIMPALLSGFDTNECRNSTVCNSEKCFGFKKVKIRDILFLNAVKLSKRLAVHSCRTVNSDFIIKVFDTYKRGVDFYNPYLSIDRYQEEKQKDESFLSGSNRFLEVRIWNRSRSFHFQKEKNGPYVFAETTHFIQVF